MTTHRHRPPQTDFKVADLSLAEFGRKEIRLAEHEMPGLMAIREEYADAQPLKGARITGSLHMTIQTAVLIETLTALGAEVRWVLLQHLLDPGPRRRRGRRRPERHAEDPQGVPVFAWKGETLEEYWWCTEQVLDLARRRRRPEHDPRRRRRRHAARAQGHRVRGRRRRPGPDDRRLRGVRRDPRAAAAARSPRTRSAGRKIGRGHQGRHRGDDDRRPPPLRDGRDRRAAVPGDQRQRLGHQVEVRQPLRLPPLARSTASTAPPT